MLISCCCCWCSFVGNVQVVENAIAAAKHLQEMGCYDIEFCAEDASRSDRDFLCQVTIDLLACCLVVVF
jgi:isopropylmalate/homocitrate/citramalate synthase